MDYGELRKSKKNTRKNAAEDLVVPEKGAAL
jgi:hypothetical protein